MDGVGDGALDLLGKSLLEGLGDDALAGGVRDLAGVLVAVCVVDGVGQLVLELLGHLLLDALGDGGVAGGVGDALSLVVLSRHCLVWFEWGRGFVMESRLT